MNLNKAVDQKIFRLITNSSHKIGQPSYVIGGYVRDFLLNREVSKKDIDVVTLGSGINLAAEVAKNLSPCPNVNTFKRFGTAMLRYKDKQIEFVGARKESYQSNSRKPFVESGTLSEDQNRRDFTINAMAISLNKSDYGKLIDPFGGMEDLSKKCLRTPLNPDITYSDDPLRMLRAIRFATELDFSIEENSFEAIKRNKDRISIVSQERIMEEFNKILLAKTPSRGLHILHKAGLLSKILPELTALEGIEEIEGCSHKDNFFHTLEVVDNISKVTESIWLRWAALLHDIGKASTKKYIPNTGWTFYLHEFVGSKMIPKLFKRLKLPIGASMKYVQKIILNSSRPISLVEDHVRDSAIRRLIVEMGEEIYDLMILCKADITTKNFTRQTLYNNNLVLVEKKIEELRQKDSLSKWKPPISGEQIMETFDLRPSKEVGMLKLAIKEAILKGLISDDFSSSYLFMLEEGKARGLEQKSFKILE